MAGLQVLTLNIWGLWLLSKKRYNRVIHLAEYLAGDAGKHDLDIVCLQEVWCDSDADLLITAAIQSGLKHTLHFRSGFFGAGLVTLSRYPILESDFHQYASNGEPAAITYGDYVARKGVGWVRVQTPAGPVDVFNTHMHANYHHTYEDARAGGGDMPQVANDDFAPFRMAQVLELSRFITHISKAGSVGTILAGDLNIEPRTLELEVLRALLPQLQDAWVVASESAPRSGPFDEGSEGHTCRAAGNTFQPRRQRPERIDYILTTLPVKDAELTLKKTPEGHSYSDHFAVRARLGAPPASASGGPAAGRASSTEGRKRLLALLSEAHTVLCGGMKLTVEAAKNHQKMGFMVLMQVNAGLLGLAPFLACAMAFASAVLLLTGLVADCGESRALHTAIEQLEVMQVALQGAAQ